MVLSHGFNDAAIQVKELSCDRAHHKRKAVDINSLTQQFVIIHMLIGSIARIFNRI